MESKTKTTIQEDDKGIPEKETETDKDEKVSLLGLKSQKSSSEEWKGKYFFFVKISILANV